LIAFGFGVAEVGTDAVFAGTRDRSTPTDMLIKPIGLLLSALLTAAAWGQTPIAPYDVARAARWQARVEQYLAEDRVNPPPSGVVLFAGSSSIDGWKSLRADFPELPVLNRGIGGFWLADLVHFAEPLVLKHQPTTVVVYAGENDIADGRSVDSVVAAFEQLDALLRSRHPETRLIFISLKPSPSRAALMPQFAEVNRRVSALCTAMTNRAFVDVFTPMLDTAGAPRLELFGPDGLHMNEAGYALWTKLLRDVLIVTAEAPLPTLHRDG
jgi:lysophospholipase L1-like esterase